MKKVIPVICSMIICLNLFGQDIEPGSIWQAKMIYDTLDNKFPSQKIERFMYFDNEKQISTLTIDEKTSWTTGEVIISYKIEAYNLKKQKNSNFKIKELRVDNFEVVNKDSIYYFETLQN